MEEQLKTSSNQFNRSLNQIKFLFELCDNDFEKLTKLENKIKDNFLFYCPGDKEEVEKVLNL